jgi:hypothetical protein
MYLHAKRESDFNKRNYRTQDPVYGNEFSQSLQFPILRTNALHDIRDEAEILMKVRYAFR